MTDVALSHNHAVSHPSALPSTADTESTSLPDVTVRFTGSASQRPGKLQLSLLTCDELFHLNKTSTMRYPPLNPRLLPRRLTPYSKPWAMNPLHPWREPGPHRHVGRTSRMAAERSRQHECRGGNVTTRSTLEASRDTYSHNARDGVDRLLGKCTADRLTETRRKIVSDASAGELPSGSTQGVSARPGWQEGSTR